MISDADTGCKCTLAERVFGPGCEECGLLLAAGEKESSEPMQVTSSLERLVFRGEKGESA